MSYDGNIAALDAHERADERFERSRPVCSNCHEPITDEKCYETGDGLMCEECALDYYSEQIKGWMNEDARNTEDFINWFNG